MAERVQVIVDAKDNASGVLRGITAQMGSLGGAVEQLTGSSINWGNVAQQVTRIVVDLAKDAYRAYTELATSVRDLSLASGTTAEEASRLLQVLDDFEIKAGDVTAATKALTKNGLAPTVETIAQLSDQYLALNTAEERNAFITENLGRGGAKWANVLKEGSAAILEMNSAVNENLILSDDQIRMFEVQRLAVDNLKDSVEGWMVQLGQNIGLTIAYNEALLRANEIYEEQGGVVTWNTQQTKEYKEALNQALAEQLNSANASLELSGALSESGESAEEASAKYGKLLSIAQRLNDATKEQIQLAGYQALSDAFSKSDGGISPEEAATLQEAGVALGIFNEGAAKSAGSILTMAAAVDTGTASLEAYIAMINSIPTSVTTTISAVTVSGTQGSLLAGADAYNNNSPVTPQAGGGDTVAGQTYLVGERGPELFKAPSNGEIVPNDKLSGGATFYGATVYIENSNMSFMEDR